MVKTKGMAKSFSDWVKRTRKRRTLNEKYRDYDDYARKRDRKRKSK